MQANPSKPMPSSQAPAPLAAAAQAFSLRTTSASSTLSSSAIHRIGTYSNKPPQASSSSAVVASSLEGYAAGLGIGGAGGGDTYRQRRGRRLPVLLPHQQQLVVPQHQHRAYHATGPNPTPGKSPLRFWPFVFITVVGTTTYYFMVKSRAGKCTLVFFNLFLSVPSPGHPLGHLCSILGDLWRSIRVIGSG